MPAPFYNAVKGTTAGTPSTGAFTPNAASAGYRAWSTVPTGWIGLVRYDDASNAWELTYSYWNGTTLSRASTQVYDSSTGSQLTLTSAATAAMVEDASEVMSHLGTTPWRGWFATPDSSAPNTVGYSAGTTAGSLAQGTVATTNYLTEQLRYVATSATTANAQAGKGGTAQFLVSTTAGHGGIEMTWRWGVSTIPTGPRLLMGLTSADYTASTAEPSAFTTNCAAFGLDSTDANIQLLVNAGTGTGTKTSTGIPLAANGWYESTIWIEPGANKVYGLLIRLDTGAIWLGSTVTNVPVTGSLMRAQIVAGLSATTGTAIVLNLGHALIRSAQ